MFVGELSNGIRYVHEDIAGEVFHLGVFINAGTRDENQGVDGVAHLTEHLLFKGTEGHNAKYIINRLEEIGSDVDAYTTKEDTVIYASFLNKDLLRVASIFSEMIVKSTFNEEEITKEKDVVIDEINSYLDTPSEQIFDDFEQIIFKSHPLGRNILGTKKSVKGLKRSDIVEFVGSNYTSSNIVISTVGSLHPDRVLKILEACFNIVPNGECETDKRRAFTEYTPVIQHQTRRGSHQSHCLIGGMCCSAADEQRGAMSLLINMLGGPAMNSILNMEIREKYGYTYNIEANYQPYSDAGVFSIYIGTDEESLNPTIELIHKELNKLCQVKLGEAKMSKVKRQQCGQIAIASESGRVRMLNNGKYLLSDGRIYTIEEIFDRVNRITAVDIMELANMYFNNLSQYSIGR